MMAWTEEVARPMGMDRPKSIGLAEDGR